MDNVRCVRSELLTQERRLGYRLGPHNSSLGSGLTNHPSEFINMTADTWVIICGVRSELLSQERLLGYRLGPHN
ncbi:hypothetical protein J6590_089725 [Homalodisca vitripennis]|nr:hypothetical protein J6590_089725 [Homalodisca vitripennis]